MHHDPAALDGMPEPGELLGGRAFDLEEERRIDLLDANAAILNSFDAAGDLDLFTRGDFGIGQRARFDVLQHVRPCACAA